MVAVFLIFCLAAVLLVGLVIIPYLFFRGARWPAVFFAVAFIAILVLLYSVFSNATQITPAGAKRVTGAAGPAASILPIYVALFGYALMGAVAAMIAGSQAVMLLTALFVITVPAVYSFYRNFLVFSAAITVGFLVAGSLTSLGSVMLRRKRPQRLGSDSLSHLLYYVALALLVGAGSFCFDAALLTETLAMGFVCAAVASLGVLLETGAVVM